MSQASEFASQIATRPDLHWMDGQVRAAIADYRHRYPLNPEEAGWELYHRLLKITDLVAGNKGDGDR